MLTKTTTTRIHYKIPGMDDAEHNSDNNDCEIPGIEDAEHRSTREFRAVSARLASKYIVIQYLQRKTAKRWLLVVDFV